jgi:hypothetical protein
MAVFSGEDASKYKGALHTPAPGLHRLEFTPAPCGIHPDSTARLYAASVKDDPGDSSVDVALKGSSGARYAISLPKPCFYESYAEAKAKTDNAHITYETPEASYTIWMVLHYKVKLNGNQVAPAVLKEIPDNGQSANSNIDFTSNIGSKTTNAISIVMYLDDDPDRDCDQPSADVFDAAQQLWKLKPGSRLFPQLDFVGQQQIARYNYNCSQALVKAHRPEAKSTVSGMLPADIQKVRDALKANIPGKALEGLTDVRKDVARVWTTGIPSEVSEDLDGAEKAIKKLIDRRARCEEVDADQFLTLTLYLYKNKAPGRADCHAMQLNVNSVVR